MQTTDAMAEGGQLAGNAGSIQVRELDGVPIAYRVQTTDALLFEPAYAAARFYPESYALPEEGVVLDVGAHIGAFAAVVAHQMPRGVVYALEPSSENFELLRRNLESRANAHAHQLALAGTRGTVRLHHAPGSVGHSLYLNPSWSCHKREPRPADFAELGEHEDVPCETLAGYLESCGVDSVEFMKMNIEGAEYDVILGSAESTLRKVKCMHLELHPNEEGREKALIKRLEELGFETKFIPTENPDVLGWLTARQSAPV